MTDKSCWDHRKWCIGTWISVVLVILACLGTMLTFHLSLRESLGETKGVLHKRIGEVDETVKTIQAGRTVQLTNIEKDVDSINTRQEGMLRTLQEIRERIILLEPRSDFEFNEARENRP